MGLGNDSVSPGQGGESYGIDNSIGQSGLINPELKHRFRDCILLDMMPVGLGSGRIKPLTPALRYSRNCPVESCPRKTADSQSELTKGRVPQRTEPRILEVGFSCSCSSRCLSQQWPMPSGA